MSVIINTDALIILISFCCSICKFFGSFFCQRQVDHILCIVSQIILTYHSSGVANISSSKDDTSVFLKFFNSFVQLKFACLAILSIILISICISLCDKIQRAWLTQLFQNSVSIGYPGNLHDDTVISLLVNLRFCAVLLHSLLELIDGI